MATRTLEQFTTGTTALGALLLGLTAGVAGVLIAMALLGGESGPSTASPTELVAEKERALAAGIGEPGIFERIGERAPDIGAAYHPGVLFGLSMTAAGAGYLVLSARRSRVWTSTTGAMVRAAAIVESLMLVVAGPLLVLVSYVGMFGD